ncbi:MAG: transketolase [Spirochaetales bacterium]|nr:transketolase [Spirochaetales bacterium]
MDYTRLQLKAAEIRKKLLTMIYQVKNGHTGGSLSSVEILTVLYYSIMKIDPKNPLDPQRDRFIMSKGHSVEGLYTILADRGFFPEEELSNFYGYRSRLIGHPSVKVPGIELNTGALGHGLSCAVGMGIAAKRDSSSVHMYCVMGDGEQAEGSVWEAAMAAAHFRLGNLTAVIDQNHLQISGKTEDVMDSGCLKDKYESFGWYVKQVDGHNVQALNEMLEEDQDPDTPLLILADTIKGKGVSFMENAAEWHHRVPTEGQFKQALNEIDSHIKEIQHG